MSRWFEDTPPQPAPPDEPAPPPRKKPEDTGAASAESDTGDDANEPEWG